MDRSKLYRAVAAFVLGGGASAALAETVSLYATDDTYLTQSAPDSTQGTSALLWTNGASGSTTTPLLKFDVSAFAGRSVTSATVNLLLNTGNTSVTSNPTQSIALM